MLHSDLFPEFGCDGELIELPERSTQLLRLGQARGHLFKKLNGLLLGVYLSA